MSHSLLRRSAVVVATAAVGSALLTVAPAVAAPAGVDRLLVLSAADEQNIGSQNGKAATRDLVEKVCSIASDAGRDYEVSPLRGADSATGLLIQAIVPGQDGADSRYCTFVAVAANPAAATLSGTATVTSPGVVRDAESPATVTKTYTLSGDVLVSDPITDEQFYDNARADASGDVVITQASQTNSARVITPKSTEQKRAARQAYERTIDKAQAKLVKALKKADGNKAKKSAARSSYAATKRAAKKKLHVAWSGDKKTVVTTTPTTSKDPFAISTTVSPGRT